MSVAAEPTLDAHARASRNGTGSSRRRAQPSTSTGAMARQTMSFANSADNAPATTISSANNASGETGAPAR